MKALAWPYYIYVWLHDLLYNIHSIAYLTVLLADDQVINGRRSYHVKWQDLPVAANTWEPEGHLVGAHAEALLAAFKDLQAARVKVRCAPA